MKAVVERVFSPEEAAAMYMGITVAALIKIIKEGGYDYTSAQPGVKPWGKGRKEWGLSESQFAAMVAGQARKMARPEVPKAEESRPAFALPGHDGKSRLRRGKGARAR